MMNEAPPVRIYVVVSGGKQWDERKPFEYASVYRTHEQAVNSVAELYTRPGFKHQCSETFEEVRISLMKHGDFPHAEEPLNDEDYVCPRYPYYKILTAILPRGATVTFPIAFADDATPPSKLEVYPVSDDDDPDQLNSTRTTLWLVATGKDYCGDNQCLHAVASAYRTRVHAIDAVAALATDGDIVRTSLIEHSDYPHDRFSDDDSAEYDNAIGHRYFLLVWCPMPPGSIVRFPPAAANKDE